MEVGRGPHGLQTVQVFFKPGEHRVPTLDQLDAPLVRHQLQLPPLPILTYLVSRMKERVANTILRVKTRKENGGMPKTN